MSYITNKEKINDYIEKNVLNFVKKKDLDYYKVIDLIKMRTGASHNMVEECLKTFINSGMIAEQRVLTIPDDQLNPVLKEMFDLEREERKDAAEAEKILDQSKKEAKDAK